MSSISWTKRLTRGRMYLWAALFVVLPAAAAWGAPPPATIGGPTDSKSYVYQYMLVGLCMALGLALLCRPRQRIQEVDRIVE